MSPVIINKVNEEWGSLGNMSKHPIKGDVKGEAIIWPRSEHLFQALRLSCAKTREEIRAIIELFRKNKITTAAYYGDVKTADREKAIDDFQEGRIKAFIGQQQAAGIGLTLTAAQTAIYYSNDFNLEYRLQSEDRCHRKGTKGNVVYIDLVAEDSIDETIATALQRKSDMAAAIVGDIRK